MVVSTVVAVLIVVTVVAGGAVAEEMESAEDSRPLALLPLPLPLPATPRTGLKLAAMSSSDAWLPSVQALRVGVQMAGFSFDRLGTAGSMPKVVAALEEGARAVVKPRTVHRGGGLVVLMGWPRAKLGRAVLLEHSGRAGVGEDPLMVGGER